MGKELVNSREVKLEDHNYNVSGEFDRRYLLVFVRLYVDKMASKKVRQLDQA